MPVSGLRQLALGLAGVLGAVGISQAASLAHPGQLLVQDGVYDNIVETSITDPLPMYGTPFASTGNAMVFPLPSFTATATSNASDLTSGALEFTFDADPGMIINTLSIFESGTFSIVGGGSVSASGALTVRYLDDLTQQLVTLADPIQFVAIPDAAPGGTFPIDGPAAGTWLGTALIDLETMGIQTSHVIVAMDNNLVASALAGGTATISKDSLTINTTLTPEPASIALMGIGLALIARRGS